MRWLFSIVIMWLLVIPVGLIISFPLLKQFVQAKTQDESYSACIEQSKLYPDMFPASNPAVAEGYCGCLREGVIVERSDMFAILQKKEPLKLQEKMNQQMEICSTRLDSGVTAQPAPASPAPPPEPGIPEGARVIHF